MRSGNGKTFREPERTIPVYGSTEVLVVGGGPAGVCAAIAAARAGAEVTLVERYGCLGGLSTGGLVIWIDRMTDWEGRLVVGGIGKEITDACAAEKALIGPPPEQWGLIIIGALGGILPDVVDSSPLWSIKLREKIPSMSKYNDFHGFFHWTVPAKKWPLGMLTQILLIAASLWYLVF